MNRDGGQRPLWGIILGLILPTLAGCGGQGEVWRFGGSLKPATSTMDRMIAAYPELSSRRFRVLADFEDAQQAALFRLEPADPETAPVITTERCRTDTGAAGLRVLLTGPESLLIAADAPDTLWALPRDWSDYHLLLMSIYADRAISGLVFTIHSGVDEPLVYHHPPIPLASGWNIIRIDLSAVAREVDPTDIRELRWSCPVLDSPATLYLDDLLLVDNRQFLFSDQTGAPGSLYVYAAGQRLVVGSTGRFELVFEAGLLTGWYELGRSRWRMRNLAGEGALGPLPVLIRRPTDTPVPVVEAVSAPAMLAVNAGRQEAVETSSLRVVVEGRCRITAGGPLSAAGLEEVQWRYTIYGDGRAFVLCRAAVRGSGPERWGMRFVCDAAAGFSEVFPAEGPAHEPETNYALFTRRGIGEADLLIAPVGAMPRLRAADPERGQLGVVWEMPPSEEGFRFAGLIRIWPPDIDDVEQAGPLVADYLRPLPLAIDVGTLVPGGEGDLEADGYDESAGCYVLRLEGRLGRWILDGERMLRFSPVFRIADSTGLDVWAYRDGRQIRSVRRDRQGDCLFMVEGRIRGRTLIEVHAADRRPAEVGGTQTVGGPSPDWWRP